MEDLLFITTSSVPLLCAQIAPIQNGLFNREKKDFRYSKSNNSSGYHNSLPAIWLPFKQFSLLLKPWLCFLPALCWGRSLLSAPVLAPVKKGDKILTWPSCPADCLMMYEHPRAFLLPSLFTIPKVWGKKNPSCY